MRKCTNSEIRQKEGKEIGTFHGFTIFSQDRKRKKYPKEKKMLKQTKKMMFITNKFF